MIRYRLLLALLVAAILAAAAESASASRSASPRREAIPDEVSSVMPDADTLEFADESALADESAISSSPALPSTRDRCTVKLTPGDMHRIEEKMGKRLPNAVRVAFNEASAAAPKSKRPVEVELSTENVHDLIKGLEGKKFFQLRWSLKESLKAAPPTEPKDAGAPETESPATRPEGKCDWVVDENGRQGALQFVAGKWRAFVTGVDEAVKFADEEEWNVKTVLGASCRMVGRNVARVCRAATCAVLSVIPVAVKHASIWPDFSEVFDPNASAILREMRFQPLRDRKHTVQVWGVATSAGLSAGNKIANFVRNLVDHQDGDGVFTGVRKLLTNTLRLRFSTVLRRNVHMYDFEYDHGSYTLKQVFDMNDGTFRRYRPLPLGRLSVNRKTGAATFVLNARVNSFCAYSTIFSRRAKQSELPPNVHMTVERVPTCARDSVANTGSVVNTVDSSIDSAVGDPPVQSWHVLGARFGMTRTFRVVDRSTAVDSTADERRSVVLHLTRHMARAIASLRYVPFLRKINHKYDVRRPVRAGRHPLFLYEQMLLAFILDQRLV